MKKFLLSIAAMMLAFASIQAEEVTFDSSTQNYANQTAITSVTIVDGKITATFDKGENSNAPKYYASGTSIRVYGGSFFTVEGNNVTITKIVLTYGSEDKTNKITTDCGTFDTNTWTGSANSVKFTIGGTSGHRRIKAITVTYTENSGTPTVATPKITAEKDYFEQSLDVTITAEEGATIYYTTDGTEPTTASDVYSAPINITATTTVKALAVKADCNDSNIAEATYTLIQKANIADVIVAGEGYAWAEGTVVATYKSGFLLSDATGYILVYQGYNPAVTVAVGDVVTVKGETSKYNGLLQFGNTATIEKTGTAEVTHPTATVMDGAAMDAYLTAPAVQYVEYTGELTISGSYYNVAVEGTTKAIGSIQGPNDGVVTAESGAVVKVTGYTIGVSSSKYVNTVATSVELVEDAPEVETFDGTVIEALAAYVDGQQTPAVVTGYIVGAMNSTGYVPEFGTTTVASNILISDNADENDIANCIIVQLSSGTALRAAVNLVDNPTNYKRQIKLTGSLEKYFQQAGLKSLTAYEFLSDPVETAIDEVETEAAEQVIYDLTGRRVYEITETGIYIVNGKKVLVK